MRSEIYTVYFERCKGFERSYFGCAVGLILLPNLPLQLAWYIMQPRERSFKEQYNVELRRLARESSVNIGIGRRTQWGRQLRDELIMMGWEAGGEKRGYSFVHYSGTPLFTQNRAKSEFRQKWVPNTYLSICCASKMSKM